MPQIGYHRWRKEVPFGGGQVLLFTREIFEAMHTQLNSKVAFIGAAATWS